MLVAVVFLPQYVNPLKLPMLSSFRGYVETLVSIRCQIAVSVVVDATGTLVFADTGKAAYKIIEVTKNGEKPFSVYSDNNGALKCPALSIGGYLVTSVPNVG